MSDGAEQAVVVKPVDPAQGRHLNRRDARPGSPSPDDLGFRPREAAAAFAKADKAAKSKSGLIQIGLGQALVAAGDPESLERATKVLRAGLDREPEYGAGYRSLAQAYGQLGRVAEADLAMADGHFYSGNYKDAKLFAARAQQKFKRGAPGWLRAQDIINYKAPSRK